MKRSDMIDRLCEVESLLEDFNTPFFEKAVAILLIFEEAGFLPPAKSRVYLLKNPAEAAALVEVLKQHDWEDEQ